MKYAVSLLVTGLAWAGGACAAPPICLQTIRIDHTDVPDDFTILFHMRDHSIYRARMVQRCVGLALDNRGFSYDAIPGSDEICSNLLTIRLNSSREICLVGPFEKIANAR